jgi:hypothetical protein
LLPPLIYSVLFFSFLFFALVCSSLISLAAANQGRATILAILLYLGGNPYIKNKRGVCVTKDPTSTAEIKKVVVIYEIQGALFRNE